MLKPKAFVNLSNYMYNDCILVATTKHNSFMLQVNRIEFNSNPSRHSSSEMLRDEKTYKQE